MLEVHMEYNKVTMYGLSHPQSVISDLKWLERGRTCLSVFDDNDFLYYYLFSLNWNFAGA